ncbi:MAG: class I SAM-dependent methyltransferase [Candidatus Nitrosocosmicus sp.]|nr:class I SAM-dependent methyltransferase [Candidatus Nitrosocosmicus sp.]
MSDRLIEMAKIKPASKVLDIATGKGEPAITVAKCVGTSGHVLATDISSQMLSIARKRAIAEHLEGIIDFKEGDAVTIPLPELSFDSALCRLGLMFLEDLDSGLVNINKSLVNGGRFAASVWATSEKVPQLALALDIVRKELDISSPPPLGTPGPFSLADENILKESFVRCGFKVIEIERINIAFEFDSALEYTNFTKDIAAPVLRLLNDQTRDRKEKIWEAVTVEATKYVKDNTGSIVLDNEAICIVGEKQ